MAKTIARFDIPIIIHARQPPHICCSTLYANMADQNDGDMALVANAPLMQMLTKRPKLSGPGDASLIAS